MPIVPPDLDVDDDITRLAAQARADHPIGTKLKGRTGRPSSYTDETASIICDLIADGESLRTICNREGMPHRMTVINWLEEYPAFSAKYARAREVQADAVDERIDEISRECTAQNAAADRVKLEALKWRAARLAPRKYGDKVEHTGEVKITAVTRKIVG